MAVLALTACGEPAAEPRPARHYDKDGLSFDHPPTWRVTEDDPSGNWRYVLVDSPGESFLGVHVIPRGEVRDLRDYVERYVLQSEESPRGRQAWATALRAAPSVHGFEVLVESLSSPLGGQVTRTFRWKSFGSKVCVIVEHVPAEEWARATRGFRQIVSTFSYDD